jgi:hypothetical protein
MHNNNSTALEKKKFKDTFRWREALIVFGAVLSIAWMVLLVWIALHLMEIIYGMSLSLLK